jgi:hypothetical protein
MSGKDWWQNYTNRDHAFCAMSFIHSTYECLQQARSHLGVVKDYKLQMDLANLENELTDVEYQIRAKLGL